jgi:hypothetical protein
MKRKGLKRSVESGVELKEAIVPLYAGELLPEQMVRTQIYLTRAEHGFLQSEAVRQGTAMSAIIRGLIDAKMTIPEDAWVNNSILEPTAVDPEYEGHDDASLNHNHYAYGAPKKYEKRNGKWVLLPLVDE